MTHLKIAALNGLWVVIVTVNSRIINAHLHQDIVLVCVSQIAVSFAYFSLVKGIQHAHSLTEKLAYCGGGVVGAALGVFVTSTVS